MDNVTIDTSQVLILEEFFNDLSLMDQRKIFMQAFRKAAKPLVNEIKHNIPYRTGNLQRSVGTVEVPKEIQLIVGTKLSGRNKGWYGHIMEEGTVSRYRRKSGGYTGRVQGTHFLERSYNATESQIVETIEQEWYNAIDRQIVNVNKKLKK